MQHSGAEQISTQPGAKKTPRAEGDEKIGSKKTKNQKLQMRAAMNRWRHEQGQTQRQGEVSSDEHDGDANSDKPKMQREVTNTVQRTERERVLRSFH
ncbi:uncharacterized protein DS421_6g187600 [Arachis hypogaea]|nr:uncharacterized protein DS421_6g187600 [Arachis hypogaea]